jgi:hypothetical protein
MDIINQSDLLKRIRTTVNPLTCNGNFQLDIIKYDISHGMFEVRLHSDEMDIIFRIYLWIVNQSQFKDIRSCLFYIPSLAKTFNAEILFSTMNLNIIWKQEGSLRGLSQDFHTCGSSIAQKKVEILLDDRMLFTDLNELCNEISQNLSAIRTRFRSDTVEETMRFYQIEIEKSKNPESRYDSTVGMKIKKEPEM